jgi:hypothetical protein
VTFPDDYGWVALVSVEPMSFGRTAKLMLGRRWAGGADVLRITEDGLLFTTVEEGMATPPDAGLDLPVEALNAIAKAIEAFQGDTGHAATEVRVLREWLTEERARVDKLIHLDGP